MPNFLDRLVIAAQRLLPARLLGRLVYRLSRSRMRWLKNALIRGFVRLYDVDVREAAAPVPDGYADFNAFFTRSLKPGARPIDADPLSVLSPADGTVQQCGLARGDELLQAKGMTYSITRLFGADPERARYYAGGPFLTAYLAPHNYHRVHMPLDGRLAEVVHIPGRRMAVNRRTARSLPGVFANNERLVCHFDGPRGPFAVVLVGALNVASISTAWADDLEPRSAAGVQRWVFDDERWFSLDRGEYLGQFNLGSTVILILPRDSSKWLGTISPGAELRAGQTIGRLEATRS